MYPKELIFFYPTTIYIILECRFLIFKENNIFQTLLKLSLLPFIFYWRGDLAALFTLGFILYIFEKLLYW